MNAPRQQRGVGVIEILVAILIIAIGFLASARMQVDSVRYSQSAYYRSQAYFMATSMVDSMRANVDGVRAGHYDGRRTDASARDPGCHGSDCTPESIAAQDLYDWSASLHPMAAGDRFVALLPSMEAVTAAGEIVRTDEGRYSVRVVWGEMVDGKATRESLSVDFVAEL